VTAPVTTTPGLAADGAPPVVVFSPALLASVTLEAGPGGHDELHIHAAGQGYWVARMLADLGAAPVLCCTAAGEIGEVARSRVDSRVTLRLVETTGCAGSYVDDRRSGARDRLAEVATTPIDRHAIDDLGAVTVAEGIRAGIAVITGSNMHGTVVPTVFERLCGNLHAVSVAVVVDLSGDELHAALGTPLAAVKVSDAELVGAGFATSDTTEDLLAGARELRARCGADVFVTCADAGALALTAEGAMVGRGPSLTPTETRGAGDSFTAAIAFARTAGYDLAETLRLGIATGASNVMRHGLGSGERDLIDAIAPTVCIERLS
jgi:1-phosphofructokinase